MRRAWPLVFAAIVLVVLAYLIFSHITLIQESGKEQVQPKPMSLFLNVSENKTFNYFGHTISIDYISSHPLQKIEVNVDGEKKIIERDPIDCTTSCGEYWTANELSLKIEPVIWVKNPEGELVWSFESWNTSQIYFEVVYTKQPIAGGKKWL